MRSHVLGGIVLSLLIVGPALAETDANARSLITVEGQGEVRLPPDKIVVVLEVEDRAASLADARATVAAAASRVLEAAAQHGVEKRDIDAADLRIAPMFDTYNDDHQRPLKRLGFRVQHTLVITVRDPSSYQDFLAAALEPGLVSVRWISAQVERTREHRDEARRMAVKAAREKAQAVAAELGQAIGRAVTIEVEGATTPCCEGSEQSPFARSMAMSNSVSEVSGPGTSQQSLGLVVLTANVKVAFELR